MQTRVILLVEMEVVILTRGERIKEVRKINKLTLEKFGERIGMKKSSVSQLENGINAVTEQTLKSICREFNVNEEWLRTGNGEMFLQLSKDDETAHIVQNMLGSNAGSFYNIILEIAKSYKKLSPNSQKALDELADNLLAGLVNKEEKDESEMTFDELIAECPKTPEELERLYPPVNIKSKVI